MSATEAYKFFNNLEKDIKQIKSLYNNLKSDVKVASSSQTKSLIRRILFKLTKIDAETIETNLKELEGYIFYDTAKQIGDNILKDIKEIKEFIYSLGEISGKTDVEIPAKPDSTEKKLDYIKDKYKFLQKQINTADTETLIKDAKRLEAALSRVNFEDLPEGEYQEMVDIKNDVSKLLKNLEGIEKSEKYGPYILTPLAELIANIYTLGNKERAESRAAAILNFIEDPKRIEMFEPAIKRIINKKMTPKEFRVFYESVMSMIQGERKFESFQNYKRRNGWLYFI